jgi:hypothetical protein
MVEDQKSVNKHEDRLWYLKGVFERSGGLGLEVLDDIVGYVTDRSASECRNLRDLDVLVVVEFLLKGSHGITGGLMSGAGLDDLEGIWEGKVISSKFNENDKTKFTCTDKAVTVGVAGSDGLQQETVL